MSRLRLLTFDVNNTILRVRGSQGQHYSAVAIKHGVQASPSELNKIFPSMWKSKNQEQPNFGVHDGVTSKQWWGDVVKRCFIMSGYQGEENVLDTIAHDLYHYYTRPDCWEVFPKSQELLSQLKTEGLQLGIISNFDERLYTILDAHNLKKYFDFVIPSKLVKCKKPDPRIFHLALKIAQVKPSQAIHIGDCINNDYLGARNAGLNALLVNNTGHSDHMYQNVDRKHILNDITEVEKHITI